MRFLKALGFLYLPMTKSLNLWSPDAFAQHKTVHLSSLILKPFAHFSSCPAKVELAKQRHNNPVSSTLYTWQGLRLFCDTKLPKVTLNSFVAASSADKLCNQPHENLQSPSFTFKSLLNCLAFSLPLDLL